MTHNFIPVDAKSPDFVRGSDVFTPAVPLPVVPPSTVEKQAVADLSRGNREELFVGRLLPVLRK